MSHWSWAACAAVLLSTSIASAQGAGTLTKTSQGYEWTRGAVRIALRDRDKAWTAAEAAKLQEGFEKLPDVLLLHAQRVGVRTWYRDARARGRLGRRSNALATTVVDQGYISCADVLLARPSAQVYYTVAHELGHAAQYAITGKTGWWAFLDVVARGTPGFSGISWTLLNGLRSYNGFVSAYARTNEREDFAESVEFYWINPDELLRVSPAKYAFIRSRVFANLDSPAASRDLTHRAIGPVVPRITRLGDSRDDPFSVVTVHGEYFMGPRDGGFNRVEYRAKRALHLPISRSRIVSWVPWLSVGPAPVTVTTQDGVSAPQAFDVKKPWWKFW